MRVRGEEVGYESERIGGGWGASLEVSRHALAPSSECHAQSLLLTDPNPIVSPITLSTPLTKLAGLTPSPSRWRASIGSARRRQTSSARRVVTGSPLEAMPNILNKRDDLHVSPSGLRNRRSLLHKTPSRARAPRRTRLRAPRPCLRSPHARHLSLLVLPARLPVNMNPVPRLARV